MKLKISPDLSLPLDFVTSTQAILAKKGKGKTYKASVQAEELLEAHQQVVAIDPTGAWYGLRSSADGKSAGYPISILGGEHADVAIEPTAGEVIADAIASEHFSAVIDLTLFRKGEALRFMAAFLETLYRKNRNALHLFIDEADVLAPQRTFGPDEARVLGACEDIVRRGRIRGIGCTLITQRPQVLNKNVLSQVDMLTTLGMNHPKDIGAIRDWVAVHGDESQAKQMIADLPALPIGEAWVWAPAANIFKRVTFRDRRTFDSGRTPRAGERRLVPRVLAPVDIARLGKTIAATVEQQKANDPRALKAEIARLEKLVSGAEKTIKSVLIKGADKTRLVETRILTDADIKRLEKAVDRWDARWVAIEKDLHAVRDEAMRLRAEVQNHKTHIAKPSFQDRKALQGRELFRSPTKRAAGEPLPVGEATTLRALIQYASGLRREQLTILTGYKRSTRDAYIARLREKGLVDAQGERVVATSHGVQAMPDAEPLPVGLALQEFWTSRLPRGETAILGVLLNARGVERSREQLSEETGFKRSTRDAYLSRLSAKELVIDVGRGYVKASPTLFEVAS